MIRVYKSFHRDSTHNVNIYHVIIGSLFWTNLSKQVIDNSIDDNGYIKHVKESDRNFRLDDDEMWKYLKGTKALRTFIIYEFEGTKE